MEVVFFYVLNDRAALKSALYRKDHFVDYLLCGLMARRRTCRT